MIGKRHVMTMIAAAYIAVFCAGAWLHYGGKFEGLEVKLIDSNFRHRGQMRPDRRIVILGFTDSCISVLGKWPWKREIHATVLSKLSAEGAKALGVDVLFQDRSQNPSDDAPLIEAVKKSGKIILSTVISQKAEFEFGRIVESKHVTAPFEELSKSAAGLGFINVNYETLNTDGILRCMPLFESATGRGYNSFSYELSRVAGFTSPAPIPGERYYINYRGGDKTYEYVTFSKVHAGLLPASYFKDRIVLIGPAATAFGDLHHTPFGTVAGTEVQANILDCIINDNFLKRPGTAAVMAFVGIAALISALPFGFFGLAWTSVINLAVLVGYLALNRLLFVKYNVILDAVPALFVCGLSYFAASLVYSYGNLMVTNSVLERRVRELNALYSISRNISELINLDKILKDVLDEAIRTLGVERGSLMLIDDDEQKLEVKVVAGFDRPVESRVLIPIGEGIAGKVFQEAESIVSNDAARDDRFKAFSPGDPGASPAPGEGAGNAQVPGGNVSGVQSQAAEGAPANAHAGHASGEEGGVSSRKVRSLLCVPLLVGEKKSIGVINIVNRRDNSAFTPDDVKLMETIAHHAATLIENSKLYKLATVDGMTGLYVHRYFQVRLKEEFSRAVRYDKNISLIMTDIDHFKKFNDTYGHQCGDMVLIHVAKIVRDTIRNIDIAARYGGEEFAVVLPETEPEGAYKLAERIRKNVEESACQTPKGMLKVTISIGIASNPLVSAPNQASLIACADAALYKSKEGGRNRVTAFSGEQPIISHDRD